MAERQFSQKLESWLNKKGDKTLFSLVEAFGDKSFALLIMLLLFPSALPLPTGGVTNLLEIIAMLVSLEMIIGRKTVWLPKKWGNKKIGKTIEDKAIPYILRRVKSFERFSRARFAGVINDPSFSRVEGLILLIFVLGAFLSPPFLGLDTLPSLGAVVVALSIILDDMVIFLIGSLLGAGGVGLLLSLYDLVIERFTNLF